MRGGALLSAILHVGVGLLAFFGLPQLFDRAITVDQPIRVEVFTIEEETAAPPVPVKPEPEPEPPPEPEPEPEPVAEPAPKPEPVKVQAPPPPERVAIVEPRPEPVIEPLPAPRLVPKPVLKPTPAAPAKPKQTFASVQATVALLDKRIRELPRAAPEAPAPPQPPESVQPAPVAPKIDRQVTLSEIDAIRRQIEANWIVPGGARDASGLVVEIRIHLAPDGTVLKAEILDQARLNNPGDGFFRVAAESARRAVLRSSPLKGLPPEKYGSWREIVLTFDPKNIVGP